MRAVKRRPCPTCKEPADLEGPHRPFCSVRCKQIDLGNWLSESYRVSRPMMPWEVEAVYDEDDEPDADAKQYLN